MILADNHTVMEEAELAFEHIFELQADLERMNQELADRTDYDSEEYHKLIDRFTHENDRFLMMGGTNFHAEIERTLIGLGFSREDFNRPTSEFSGGWRMRIELAKLLLRKPDVLLLDEPTNHLDIESIQWLETFLSTRANAVVLVSHDRAFLNNVTTRTIEITCGQIYDYKVKYDEYIVLRQERREQQLRAYENQQKQIEDADAAAQGGSVQDGVIQFAQQAENADHGAAADQHTERQKQGMQGLFFLRFHGGPSLSGIIWRGLFHGQGLFHGCAWN